MSREDRIVSKLEGACSLIEFLNREYPDVLTIWKNKNAGAYEAPADYRTEAITPKDQLGYDHRDK
jgi:hypothetical protein